MLRISTFGLAYYIKETNSELIAIAKYVTKFAKRGLIHASNFSTLRMCNSTSIGPTALEFGSKSFLSLY